MTSLFQNIADIRTNAANTDMVADELAKVAQVIDSMSGKLINKRVISAINDAIDTSILSARFDDTYFMGKRDGYNHTSGGIVLDDEYSHKLACIDLVAWLPIRGYSRDRYDSTVISICPHTDKTTDKVDSTLDVPVIAHKIAGLHHRAISMRENANNLPRLAKTVYNAINEFKNATNELYAITEKDWRLNGVYLNPDNVPANDAAIIDEMRKCGGYRERGILDSFTKYEYSCSDNGASDHRKFKITGSYYKLICSDGNFAIWDNVTHRWVN